MPASLFVDSGAFIGLFSADDQHHDAADAIFHDAVIDKMRLVTTNLVLSEVHRFLLFRAGIRAASVALDRIEASPSVTIEFATTAHHRAARSWLAKLHDQKISYTDAVSFAVMKALRCKSAISFDHDFELAGFRVLRASRR